MSSRPLCWECMQFSTWDWVEDQKDANGYYWRVRECRNCKTRRRYLIRKSDAVDPVRV